MPRCSGSPLLNPSTGTAGASRLRLWALLLIPLAPLAAAGGVISEPMAGLLLLLGIGLPVVLLAKRFGISSLIAYLVVGYLVSKDGFDLVDEKSIAPLANIGATLVLFTLGLELDLISMRKQLRQVLIGAIGQIGSTMLVGYLLMLSLGLNWKISLAVGACLALSSTLMVIRALDTYNLRNKPVGQMVLGLLLTQDMALAPLTLMVALLFPAAESPPQVLWLVIGTIATLVATWYLRLALASKMFSRVRSTQLPELEVAFSIAVALGAAYLTEWVGLGSAVGAFCAGLALGGDEHSHTIETSTRPLQGLLAIVFFASIGFKFDPMFVWEWLWVVIAGLVVSVAFKAALAAAAFRLAGLSTKQAIGGGIMIGQVGEFSFVIAASIAYAGAGDPETEKIYKLIVAVSCLSLALTPFLVQFARGFLPQSSLRNISDKGDTIVVAGLGPVGNNLVESLHGLGHRLFLVDRNQKLLDPWENTQGVRSHLGKIEDMDDWMPALGHRPKIVVLTFPIADTSALVAQRLRALDPDLTVIARSPFQSQVDQLHNAGAQYVICDERAVAESLEPLLAKVLDRVYDDSEGTSSSRHLTSLEDFDKPTKAYRKASES